MRFITLFANIVLLIWSSSAKQLNGRIIGGIEASTAQFAFVAAIDIRTANSAHFCAGTVISNQWILTAAQCVQNAVSFTIKIGSNTLTENDPNRVTLATSEYFIHPYFDPFTLQNDIGLVKLRLPFTYTSYARQVHFMPTYRLQDQAPTLAVGWGQIDDDQAVLENRLRYVNLTTLSMSECQETYGSQITEDMVCAAGNYNEGTCIGDMGGPLLQHVGRGYYLHVGIASFISNNGCESINPSGFTRSFGYMEWIKNITGLTFQTVSNI